MTMPSIKSGVFVFLAFLMLGIGGLIAYTNPKPGQDYYPEIQMGLVVVFAIVSLMVLLFLVANGFSYLNLTDAKQPLGLPEGSIRAMIALVLIMVFIIFGIHLFRMVGGGYSGLAMKNKTWEEVLKLNGKPAYIQSNSEHPENYDVWLQVDISADGARLAQQLITTVGTLVVAVAGFYFGSTVVSSAVATTNALRAPPDPKIQEFLPKTSSGPGVDFKITGENLNSTKGVRLIQGTAQIVAENILSNESTIRGEFNISNQPKGDWDVVVEIADGRRVKTEKAFSIT